MKDYLRSENLSLHVVWHGWHYCPIIPMNHKTNTSPKPFQSGHAGPKRPFPIPPQTTAKKCSKSLKFLVHLTLPSQANIELLSEFFEFKHLALLRVQSLHLLLTLRSRLTKNLNEIIPLYASLAQTYLRLGYTGKAGTLFAHGLKHMKDSQPSQSTLLSWHLSYAEYFARISNTPKANHHMSQAGAIYSTSYSRDKKWIEPAERAERVLAVGQAGFVLSLIAFEESELEKAIGHIDYAIRVLKTGIMSAERAGRVAKMGTREYDPFSSDPRPAVEEVESKGIQFGSKLWGFKSVRFGFWFRLMVGFLYRVVTTWNVIDVSRVSEER
jgi:hypothetical protein